MIEVYWHPNRKDYVAEVDGHGWVRWPAIADGWRHRVPCDPAEAGWDAPPEALSWLALVLTGGPADDDRDALREALSALYVRP